MKVTLGVCLVVLLAWKAEAEFCWNPTTATTAMECAAPKIHCKYASAAAGSGLTLSCEDPTTSPATTPALETAKVQTDCVDKPNPEFVIVGEAAATSAQGATLVDIFKPIQECHTKRTPPVGAADKFCFNPKDLANPLGCNDATKPLCQYTVAHKTDDMMNMVACAAGTPSPDATGCTGKDSGVITLGPVTVKMDATDGTKDAWKLFRDCKAGLKDPPSLVMTTTAAPAEPPGGDGVSMKPEVLVLLVTSVLGAVAKSFM